MKADRLVDALRAAGRLSVSLVAEDLRWVLGYIAFSRVTVGSVAGGLGLSPFAVRPDCQRRGAASKVRRNADIGRFFLKHSALF